MLLISQYFLDVYGFITFMFIAEGAIEKVNKTYKKISTQDNTFVYIVSPALFRLYTSIRTIFEAKRSEFN